MLSNDCDVIARLKYAFRIPPYAVIVLRDLWKQKGFLKELHVTGAILATFLVMLRKSNFQLAPPAAS